VLRSHNESLAIAIRLPNGEELQQHHVHERPYMLVSKVAGDVSGGRRAGS
jgi:hypothetical protein